MIKDRDYKTYSILFGILTIAFFLRIHQWFNFLGADEIRIMGWVHDLHKDPLPVHPYPPLFLYINYLFSFVLKQITIFLGIIDFDTVFWKTDLGFVTTLKAGRILSSIFGTLNVYMVFLISREFINKNAALLSSAILAVCWPHVIDSHNFKSDILLSLLLTIVVYYSLKFSKSGSLRYLVIASFIFGLSFAAKYNGVFVVVILLITIFLKRKELKIIKGLFYFSFCSLIGFLAGAPNWIAHPISNIKEMFGLLHGLTNELVWYDKFPSSYLLYGKNLLEAFGLLLMLFFLFGLVLSFIKKNRSEILISITFLFYFLMIGRESYLNYRAIHILFVLISIIIGKFVFSDIKTFVTRSSIRNTIIVLLAASILLFTYFNLNKSYKSFNLLKAIASHATREKDGIGKEDYSSFYAFNHLKKGSSIFREMWTPPLSKLGNVVFGIDITRLPLKRFSKRSGFDFLLTSFRTNYIINKTKNRTILKEARKRLENYIPFHKIYRPRIFTWSNDVRFWYRKPDFIRKKTTPDSGIKLPRLIYSDKHNPAIFLPLQRYEKDPCAGKIQNGKFTKFLISKTKIRELNFSILSLKKLKLNINVNEKSFSSKLSGNKMIENIKLDNINPEIFKGIGLRRLWEVSLDEEGIKIPLFIYKIEIISSVRIEIPFVFAPVYAEKVPLSEKYTRPIINEPVKSNTPELFGNDKSPDWIKKIYRETGVDLILLSDINSLDLYSNNNNSTDNIDTGFFQLGEGAYSLEIDTEEIVPGITAKRKGRIEIQKIDANSVLNTIVYDIKGPAKILLKENSRIGFYRIKIIDSSKSNILVKKIGLSFNFPEFFKTDFLGN